MAQAHKTDIFLTHEWGVDGQNHARVSIINKRLKKLGYTTWFDEEQMEGNIRSQMVSGIDNTRLVLVFITKRYMKKINDGNRNDNCFMEYNYAFESEKKMLCVAFDDHTANSRNWTGTMKMTSGKAVFFVIIYQLFNRISGA